MERYRTNPFELAILALVASLFVYSAYDLFQAREGFEFSALTPEAGDPKSEGRTLASVPMGTATLELGCEPSTARDTTASKLRLTGSLCDAGARAAAGTDGSRLVKTVAGNSSNNYSATLFTDLDSGKFSTEYIPLLVGRNTLRVEFHYADGKIQAHDVEITRSN